MVRKSRRGSLPTLIASKTLAANPPTRAQERDRAAAARWTTDVLLLYPALAFLRVALLGLTWLPIRAISSCRARTLEGEGKK